MRSKTDEKRRMIFDMIRNAAAMRRQTKKLAWASLSAWAIEKECPAPLKLQRSEYEEMKNLRFYPKFDKLYLWITLPTAALMLLLLVLTGVFRSTGGLIVMACAVAFVGYFLISPCFGYVELREETVFIKFGFFLKREIPYARIRGIEKKRTAIADSMLSLKNALNHVNIKYASFDCVSISVKNEEKMIDEIKRRSNILN